eukprot:236151-Amphidinium_carterae.3
MAIFVWPAMVFKIVSVVVCTGQDQWIHVYRGGCARSGWANQGGSDLWSDREVHSANVSSKVIVINDAFCAVESIVVSDSFSKFHPTKTDMESRGHRPADSADLCILSVMNAKATTW